MGTLTAGEPVLDHYCEHKLPTSCRLSSIGECCACYDERPHAPSYSTYIDGIGFVPRGNRWQRYCWFCKEFWANRVEASGLRPAQTRIPEVPDQSEFLARWYDFHRGYRIVLKEDGSEERVAVLGENLRDVDPGCLPRTLEELRAGRERNELEEQARRRAQEQANAVQETTAEPSQSLEDTLEQMFQAADREQHQPVAPRNTTAAVELPASNIHAQAMVAVGSRNREYQARRIAALRRELHRMRNGIERVISGLRDLGENVPDHTEASNRLSELGQTLDTIDGSPSQDAANRAINSVNALTNNTATIQSDRTLANIQARVDEARQYVNEARRNRDSAATELDLAEHEFTSSQSRLRQLQNEQRTTENYMRLFGTREEMAAQGETYESPIGGMFTRAMERFRVAEEVRREERTLRQVLEDEQRTGGEGVADRLAEIRDRQRARDVWGVPRPSARDNELTPLRQTTITQYTSPALIDLESDPGSGQATLENYGLLDYQRNLVESEANRTTEPAELSADSVDAASRQNPQEQEEQELQQRRAMLTRRRDFMAQMIASATGGSTDEFADATVVAGPPGQQLDDDPQVNNDRGLDALFVLSALRDSDTLRSRLAFNPSARIIARFLRSVEGNSLGWADRENIETILDERDVVWGSQLPAERNRRRRERGEHVTFNDDAFENATAGIVVIHDVEIMAECFQMSAQVRRQSGLSPPEQLAMLYRLQRGERTPHDRAFLERMLSDDAALGLARTIHEQNYNEVHGGTNERLAFMERTRREAAREGDHSRAELDAQRRATRTLALAAGRAAFQAGPAALFEQMANRDEETRAAYEQVQANGFVPPEEPTSRETQRNRDPGRFGFRHLDLIRRQGQPLLRRPTLIDFGASPDGTDSENESDDEHRGLDAKDTGRPEEPLTDEQMTVKMDCQICYSQMAEIACLPCGHLIMCKWCSDQHSPTMAHDRTRPRRAANCPLCRKQIRQKVRVFRG